MSSPADHPEDGDWRATLEALQQVLARLLTQGDALRSDLARPTATGDEGRTAEGAELRWELGQLPEAERVALYESVGADLQLLDALTEKLVQLSDLLETSAPQTPTISP
jgi:hypothetical protein